MSNKLSDNLLSHDRKHLFLEAYYFKQWVNFQMEHHSHDRVEFMYVLEGKCCVKISEIVENLRKGDFILLDAGVSHALDVSSQIPCRMLNLELVFRKSDSSVPTLQEASNEVDSLKSLLKSGSPYYVFKDEGNIYTIIRNIINESDQRQDGYKIIVQQLLCELFIKTSRLYCLDNFSLSSQGVYADKTIRFLYQNYDRAIDISTIAAEVNIHPSYLQRVFKSQTGKTVFGYLQGIRIEKSRMFLRNSDMSVNEIAYHTGFNDPKYFAACFKKETQTTPSDFRKQTKHRVENF